MAVGANIQYKNQRQLIATLKRMLGQRAITSKMHVPQIKHLAFSKAASAPTNANAADTPNRKGDIVIYYGATPAVRTPLSAWLCTNVTTPTFVQIA